MDQNNPDFSENALSKLNSGGLINIRIHNLWVERHKFAQKGLYSKWNDILDAIWCELGADVMADSREEREYWKLTLEFAEASGVPIQLKGFEKISKEQKGSLMKQKVALIRKELFLRRLQNKQGKGTAYLDEDEIE
jgi:hypothetical protein